MTGTAPRWQKRHTLVAFCFAATLVCYLDRVNMSVAAIALQEQFGWSEKTKGAVLSAFFLGYLAMQVPSALLANRYGGKLVLALAVAWWSAFTMLTPAAASASLLLLVVTRVALGLGEAATFPSIFSLYRDWIPPHERSRAVTITMAAAHLGTLAAVLATGWIIATYGWPAAFYGFGLLGVAWALLWRRSVALRPELHGSISREERELLAPLAARHDLPPGVPWKRLLSERAVWALMTSHFCVNWIMYTLLAWMPSYFRTTLGVSITGAALYAAAPYLVSFACAVGGGWIADRLLGQGWSATRVRKSMQGVGLLGAATALLLARGAASAPEAVLAMCASLGFLALTFSGTAAAVLEIAPRYSDVLSGLSNTLGTLPGVIAVAATGWLVDATRSYDAALLATATIGVVGALVWLAWGSAGDVLAGDTGAAAGTPSDQPGKRRA